MRSGFLRTSDDQGRAVSACSSIYEEGALREVTGVAIRPGGLTLTDRAIGACGFIPAAELLDVGCGAGATVEHLCSSYGFIARGVDISLKLIAEGLGRTPSLSLTEAAAESLPFAAESMDGILCECVLSLLEEPLAGVLEFQRVLRGGGYLILSDMYNREPADDSRNGAVPRRQLEAWLFECGFTPLFWEDHSRLLRELAARLILAHGTLDGWCCVTDKAGIRPGYYLLVARKNDTENH